MAISTPTYLGSNSSNTSVSSWGTSVTAGPAAGERALLWVVSNNIATADGPSNTHLSVTGSGLSWTKIAETTASSGAAGDGITISAWLSDVAASAIGTLSFTVEFSAAVTIKLAQARSVAGSNIGIDASATRTNYNLAAYGSMTLSGLPSKERLWVRMSGGEYGASTNATPTSGWTINTGTNTGSTTSGALARSEYKIATSTEETSAFTQNIALDSASIFIALSEDGGGTAPTGTVTIGTITPSATSASVPYSYSAADQTGFEYRLNGGTAASIGTSPATISGLTASTPYSIEVRAINASGAGAWSAVSNFTTSAAGDTEVPSLTGSVTFTSITQTSYTAQWPAGSDNVAVTGYEYQIGSAAGAWTDAGNNLSAAITGRTAGTTETVYVRAYDAAGLRSTPAISGEVTLESIPAAGINVTAPLKNNTGTLLANLSGVGVAILSASDFTYGLTTNASGILATISDAAIIPGQQYHVAIKLADGGVGITGPITAS